jgi:hypothetical protein
LAARLHNFAPEKKMTLQTTDPTNYPVEISGWDAQGAFFVATASLNWSESGTRIVSLRRRLRPGSLVFLRLLTPAGLGKCCPSPHTVEVIEGPDRAGWSKVRLLSSQPRHAIVKSPEDSLEHLILCVSREVKP